MADRTRGLSSLKCPLPEPLQESPLHVPSRADYGQMKSGTGDSVFDRLKCRVR